MTDYGDDVLLEERGIRERAMEVIGIIGAVLVLVLFSTPLLTVSLLLLIVALKFLQLLFYGLAWLCRRLGGEGNGAYK